jgi:hypothetical protein
MGVVSPPEQPRSDDLEALIREARARQWKRRLRAAAVVAVLAASALGSYALVGGNERGKNTGAPRGRGELTRCRASDLRLSSRGNGAFTSHSIIDFTFTNVSSGTCMLRGWPALQLVMRAGRRTPAHEGRIHNACLRVGSLIPVRTVVLRPGDAASFNVMVLNQVGTAGPLDRSCTWSRALMVTPPGDRLPLRFAGSLSNCGVDVTPVVAGRIDRYQVG